MFDTFRKSTIPAQIVAGALVVAAMIALPYSPPADARIAGNGIAVNGIAVNRIATNRITLNRIATNRIATNRIALNRIALNGAALNTGKADSNPFAGMNRQAIAR